MTALALLIRLFYKKKKKKKQATPRNQMRLVCPCVQKVILKHPMLLSLGLSSLP